VTCVAPLRQIIGFSLSIADPQPLLRFYLKGLGFDLIEEAAIPPGEMQTLTLNGSGRRWTLSGGGRRLHLDRFDALGAAYPWEIDAADLAFQHCAICVKDAEASYRRAVAHGAVAISKEGPVALPMSSGGVIAVKFRDPEGHPLEFLQFPHQSCASQAGDRPLGIDHSAISVSDLEVSARFYEARGLRRGVASLNVGAAQAALDGLSAPTVNVVPLLPATPAPHLELLCYHGRHRRRAGRVRVNDLAATRVVWASDLNALLRDPDGHLHELRRDR